MLKLICDEWISKNYTFLEPKNRTNLFFEKMGYNFNPETDIYIQIEPDAIMSYQDYLIKNYTKFKYILTFNQEIIQKCPNARKYLYGTTWMSPKDYETINIENKEFKISTIVGDKSQTIGHRLRKTILDNEHRLRPIDFYVSNSSIKQGKEIVGLSKFKTFKTYQYQIVVENSQQLNYFTEKLIDCLITKTIPIYWGCPNIHEYFDTTGWIIFNDIQELQDKLNSLTSESFFKYSDVIQSNFLKSKDLTHIDKNINRVLETLIDY